MLQTRIIPSAPNAYQYPLLIKSLLLSGSRYERTREIVYRDQLRYSYATFNERVARLANVLTEAGVRAGDTVAVMDWDSHRYLECMFAIPMIGAVLHTINIRLSADQIDDAGYLSIPGSAPVFFKVFTVTDTSASDSSSSKKSQPSWIS